MAKKVAFFSDNESPEAIKPGAEDQAAILQFLKADEVLFVSPVACAGFRSGIDWDDLSKQGVVAMVFYGTNDACVIGLSLECECLELGAFEFHPGYLVNLTCVSVGGRREEEL